LQQCVSAIETAWHQKLFPECYFRENKRVELSYRNLTVLPNSTLLSFDNLEVNNFPGAFLQSQLKFSVKDARREHVV